MKFISLRVRSVGSLASTRKRLAAAGLELA